MVAYLDGVAAKQAERDGAARARVREQLRVVVGTLVDQFRASKVVFFGSQARGTATESSDVDLLVTGLDSGRYFSAITALERVFDGPTVDLVRIEDCRANVLARALAEGEVLCG